MTLRRLLVAAAAVSLALLVPAATPRVVRACSCVPPQPLAEYAREASAVIFSGLVDGRAERGVHVRVERWFAGIPRADVWIAGDFGDSASCGVGAEPPVGSRWIWVAWRPHAEDDPTILLCYPFGDLATPEGQALLAEAIGTFGDGAPPSPNGSEPAPGAGQPGDGLTAVAVAIAVVLGTLVLGGAAVVARRRRGA